MMFFRTFLTRTAARAVKGPTARTTKAATVMMTHLHQAARAMTRTRRMMTVRRQATTMGLLIPASGEDSDDDVRRRNEAKKAKTGSKSKKEKRDDRGKVEVNARRKAADSIVLPSPCPTIPQLPTWKHTWSVRSVRRPTWWMLPRCANGWLRR